VIAGRPGRETWSTKHTLHILRQLHKIRCEKQEVEPLAEEAIDVLTKAFDLLAEIGRLRRELCSWQRQILVTPIGDGRSKTLVYHNVFFPSSFPAFWPGDYELVAIVETDDLDKVYAVTNDETAHPEVRCKWIRPSRSTSVGDVVVTSDGLIHRVERCGWSRIEEGSSCGRTS